MAQTEAQLRASKKYHAKFDTVQIRVPQGEKERIAEHAKNQEESLNTFVRRAIQETMERDASKKTASSGCEENDKRDA
jgi:predicted HicB family RNase H-like nuclease